MGGWKGDLTERRDVTQSIERVSQTSRCERGGMVARDAGSHLIMWAAARPSIVIVGLCVCVRVPVRASDCV